MLTHWQVKAIYGDSGLLTRSRVHGRYCRPFWYPRADPTLVEYLEAGESIDEFLQGFPSVTRDQVVLFLETATERLLASSI